VKIETAEHQEHPGAKCYRGRAETLELIEQARLAVLRCDSGTLYKGAIEIEFYHPAVEFPQWDDPRYGTGKTLGSDSPAGSAIEPPAELAAASARSSPPLKVARDENRVSTENGLSSWLYPPWNQQDPPSVLYRVHLLTSDNSLYVNQVRQR